MHNTSKVWGPVFCNRVNSRQGNFDTVFEEKEEKKKKNPEEKEPGRKRTLSPNWCWNDIPVCTTFHRITFWSKTPEDTWQRYSSRRQQMGTETKKGSPPPKSPLGKLKVQLEGDLDLGARQAMGRQLPEAAAKKLVAVDFWVVACGEIPTGDKMPLSAGGWTLCLTRVSHRAWSPWVCLNPVKKKKRHGKCLNFGKVLEKTWK